ncbi:hypothetical protein RRK67_004022 [Vibrio fluvialis]|nr:hypothetical protein [Vibrio fluvialis]
MSLSQINLEELRYGFASGEYKGFSVTVKPCRNYYVYSVMLMLEDDSDAAHVIASGDKECTLGEVKAAVKLVVNDYPYSSKELLNIHRNRCLNNLDTKEIFVRDTVTGDIFLSRTS